MGTKTIMVKLKRPSRRKHHMWVKEQNEFAKTVNDCVQRLSNGEKLSSKNVRVNLAGKKKLSYCISATKAFAIWR